MCAAQRNRKIKSKRAIPEWKLVGPSDLPCSSNIGSVSIPYSCWLELLEKALDSQPTFEILEKKDTYYSFKITQFLKDNFWSVIGHKLQLSLLRKKKIFWDLKCPSFLVYVRSSFQQGRWDAEEFPYLIKWHI